MKLWRMAFRVGDGGDEMWPTCLQFGVAAITYDPLARIDLSKFPQNYPKDLWAKLSPPQKYSLRQVAYVMEKGDIIFVKQGANIIGKGLVKGSYQFDTHFRIIDTNGIPWAHQVPVEWQSDFVAVKMSLGDQQRYTVRELRQEVLVELEKEIKSIIEKDATEGETYTFDHQYWASEVLKFLVEHVRDFRGGKKFIHYGELAKAINYPEPQYGNLFANRIGRTLGQMGRLIDNVPIDGEQPPYIQALVVRTGTNLPGDGIKEFYSDYPNLPKDKKKDLIAAEYQRIFDFGSRWEELLLELGIATDNAEIKKRKDFLHNPYGSEGSPEHKALGDYVYENPAIFGIIAVRKFREYPLKSGDIVDVFFETATEIIGVEVKSARSGDDDLERGIFQCVTYRAVLESENFVREKTTKVKCFLVIESALPRELRRTSDKLNVEVWDNFKQNRA